ncbi:MAG: DJ-1/PfpI family protein [Anaerolineae bacterium]|nr:DJ-1/PfpI family protein [Anaerolineae bacterium]MDW8298401.1 DJ-1/PfpI family protein [Anaerolineae bacterium]
MAAHNVAILLFDEVEVLDFCGPFEVFSVVDAYNPVRPFHVYTVAEKTPILARNGLSVNPTYLLDDPSCPVPDLIVVPGGRGTRQAMLNERLLAWIRTNARRAQLTLSVCTGALMLARAGLLEGLSATTHHSALEELRAVAPNTVILPDQRIVDNGNIIVSAGISAGIDMALHVVARLCGVEMARQTAAYMEYDWRT